jgi:hypothetical protein
MKRKFLVGVVLAVLALTSCTKATSQGYKEKFKDTVLLPKKDTLVWNQPLIN